MPPDEMALGIVETKDAIRNIINSKLNSPWGVKILYVCRGNIFRSALMHVLTQDFVIKHGINVKVKSVGLSTYEFTKAAARKTMQFASDKGVSQKVISKFTPRGLRQHPRALVLADIIFVAAEEYRTAILDSNPQLEGKVFLFNELLDRRHHRYGQDVIDGKRDFEHIYYTLKAELFPILVKRDSSATTPEPVFKPSIVDLSLMTSILRPLAAGEQS